MERPSGREESEDERLDRNLGELLQELRVALPGVQVLFAFLLAVPFQAGFRHISAFQEKVYFITLLCTAISAAMLISPTAYHRLTFRLQQMTGAIMLVTDVLFGGVTTAVTSALAGGVFFYLWYLMPLRRRISRSARE